MIEANITNIESRIKQGRYHKEFLLGLYERMVLIREFEEQVKFLFLEGSMPGTIHQCLGQEATAVGVCAALKSDDFITSTHRPHGHALAKGLTPEEMLKELFGRSTGCCKGKGGSMHIGNMDRGMVPAIAIVGGGIPVATGIALAFKMQKTSQVAVCFFGEGASAEGSFHEAVNMAAIWDLPVIFACENNLYGASTSVKLTTRLKRIADRAAGYGIKGERIYGNNVLEVYETTQEAVQQCRNGKGPVLLEMMTYRITGHSRRDPCHYQPKEEKESWKKQDPIKLFGAAVVKTKVADEKDLERIREKIEGYIQNAIEIAQAEPEPTVEDLTKEVFAE